MLTHTEPEVYLMQCRSLCSGPYLDPRDGESRLVWVPWGLSPVSSLPSPRPGSEVTRTLETELSKATGYSDDRSCL